MPREEHWDREFVAGWFDGMRAARSMILNRVRHELKRFGLTVDARGTIVGLHAMPPPPRQDVPEKDNPDRHPAYEEGWERGLEKAHESIRTAIQAQLADRGLFVSPRGSVTTIQVAGELVDLFRHRVTPGGPDDQAIHAFIDGVLQDTRLPTTAPNSKPSIANRLSGAWTMIRRKMNRRVAAATLTGIIATTALAWLGFKGPWGERRAQSQPAASESAGWWAGLAPDKQAFYQAWDQVVLQVEASSPPPATPTLASPFNAIANLINMVMSQSGQDELKRKIAYFIASSQRGSYIVYLLPGMAPANSLPETRTTIASCLIRMALHIDHQAFTSEARGLLVAAYSAEQDTYTQQLLDRLLTMLQEPH